MPREVSAILSAGGLIPFLNGNTKAVCDRLLSLGEYSDVLGLSEVENWEKKYLSNRA